MNKRILLAIFSILMFSVLSVGLVAAQDAVELRITWYDDGNEGVVLRELLDRFEAENPDITVVVDTVAYQVILDQVPVQVQAGEGPDMVRLTNIPGLAGFYLDMRPYLEDAAAWDENFPALVLQAMRTADDTTGLYGYPTQFTVTGPFINRTLFEQAGIEVPSDTNDAVTWEEWTAITTEVAAATETPYAVTMDRTGHRFAGPAMSMGATYFDEEGNFTIDTPGFRQMSELLIQWHEDGITPLEVWAAPGGGYVAGKDFFVNGQVVMYMSGSWQIQAFANEIGDAFDWAAVPNPSGAGGSTAMPGGAALVAVGDTEHPEEVARVMEFLASEEILGEFSAKTLFIPGHLGLAASGVDYETDNAAAAEALNVFLAQIPSIQEQAYQLNGHPQNFAVFTETRDRLSQVLVGELTLDEAIERIQQGVDDAVAAAAG